MEPEETRERGSDPGKVQVSPGRRGRRFVRGGRRTPRKSLEGQGRRLCAEAAQGSRKLRAGSVRGICYYKVLDDPSARGFQWQGGVGAKD